VTIEKGRGKRRASSARSPSSVDGVASLPPPPGLRVERIVLDEEYLVLSFPIPKFDMPASLTAAEREVALAVLRGEPNEEIARNRKTSMRTVANQVAAIFAKIGVVSRVELARALAPSRESGRPGPPASRRSRDR
jgi:DNA-binding NarL/FixJ family response regulator